MPAANQISPSVGVTHVGVPLVMALSAWRGVGFGPPRAEALYAVDPGRAATKGNWATWEMDGRVSCELYPKPPENPVTKNAGGPPNSPVTCAKMNIDGCPLMVAYSPKAVME